MGRCNLSPEQREQIARFQQNLPILRARLRFSQTDLAEKSGVSVPEIALLEKGSHLCSPRIFGKLYTVLAQADQTRRMLLLLQIQPLLCDDEQKSVSGSLLIIGRGLCGQMAVETAKTMNQWEQVKCISCMPESPSSFDALRSRYGQAVAAYRGGAFRLQLLRVLKESGFVLPVLVHPRAKLASGTVVGEGTVLYAGAVVESSARVGRGCLLGRNAVIEKGGRLADGQNVGLDDEQTDFGRIASAAL